MGVDVGGHGIVTVEPIAGAAEDVNPPVLLTNETVNATVCALAFAVAAVIDVAKFEIDCAPAASSAEPGLAAIVNVGASFTALTVIVKFCDPLTFTFGAVLLPLSV